MANRFFILLTFRTFHPQGDLMKTLRKFLAVTIAAALALHPIFAGPAQADLAGFLAARGGGIRSPGGNSESTGSDSDSTQRVPASSFSSPYSKQSVQELVSNFKSSFPERSSIIGANPAGPQEGTVSLETARTTLGTGAAAAGINPGTGTPGTLFPGIQTSTFFADHFAAFDQGAPSDTTAAPQQTTSLTFMRNMGTTTPSNIVTTPSLTSQSALNTLDTTALANTQYKQATWASTPAFTNTFDFNNDLKVDSNDISQMKDLNGDTVVDTQDTALFNNVLDFDTLSGTQQILAVRQLAPVYGSAVINALVSQEKTSVAVDIVSSLSTQKAAAIGEELAKTASGQEAGAEVFAAMASSIGTRDRAASVINAMTPASAASILARMPATASATIIKDYKTTNAGAILREMSRLQGGAKIAASILADMAGTAAYIDRASSIINDMESAAAANIMREMDKTKAAAIIKNENMSVASAANIFNELAKTPSDKIGFSIVCALLDWQNAAGQSLVNDKVASIFTAMDTAAAAGYLTAFDGSKIELNIPAVILGNSKMPQAKAIQIVGEMAETAAGAAVAAKALVGIYEGTGTRTKATAILNGLSSSAQAAVKQALGTTNTNRILGVTPGPSAGIPGQDAGTGPAAQGPQTTAGATYTLSQIAGKTVTPGTIVDDGTNKYVAMSQFSVGASGAIPETVRFNKLNGLEGEHFIYSAGQFTQITFVPGSSYTAGDGKKYTALSSFTIDNGKPPQDAILKDTAGNVYKTDAAGAAGNPVTVYAAAGAAGAKIAAGSVVLVDGKYYVTTKELAYTSAGKLPIGAYYKNGWMNYMMDPRGRMRGAGFNDTTEAINDLRTKAALSQCRAADATFADGSITIFWTNEAPIPVDDLNNYVPGWDLRMLITADFDNDGDVETQDWDLHPSMVHSTGRAINLDMPAELNGKDVTVAFYVVDANGKPLVRTTDAQTGTLGWNIGSATDKAYVFGAGVPNLPETALTFTVNRDPTRGEQLPRVTGYKVTGGTLTLQFASELHPSAFTAFYVVVNGEYTQISDYQYMLSEDMRTLTINTAAFGININPGDKVQIVAKEWSAGMTPLQTVIAGTTTPPAPAPVSVKVGDSVTIGDKNYVAKTAFTYNANGTIPANVQLNDAQGRLFTTTATGLQQNSFLVGDPIKISSVDYTVKSAFTFKADGSIPQGTKFLGTDNKMYMIDATGALKLESSIVPVAVKVGDSVTIGDKAYTAKTAFTYNANGTIPANVQLNDAQGRLFTTTATGLQQNSFLVGDPIKISSVDYTVKSAFTFKADGSIPQGTKFLGTDNKMYIADATGALKLETSSQPVQVNVGDPFVMDGKTYYFQSAFTSTGKIPDGIQLKDEQGRLFTLTADGLQQNSFLIGDKISIGNVEYTVSSNFFFSSDGKIPQGTKFTDASNKIYVADAAGVLKIEAAASNQTVTLTDGTVLTAKEAYTAGANGQIPAGVEFTDTRGHTYTVTIDGSFRQTGFIIGDSIELTDGTILTALQAYSVTGDSMPANIKFSDPQGHTFITTADGMFRQIGFRAGDTLELTDGTILTALQDYTVTGDDMPSNIKFKDAAGRQYITTNDGFRQLSYKAGDTIPLSDGSVLTISTDVTVTDSGNFPANITLTDSNGHTFITTNNGMFRQIGFKAGDTLELTDGTILTALQDYTVTGDDMPSNIKFKDAAGRQYITTNDGFRQLSYKAGDQIELIGGTKLTASSDFTVTSTGDFPEGIEFTDSQNQKWVTTEDGSFRKVA